MSSSGGSISSYIGSAWATIVAAAGRGTGTVPVPSIDASSGSAVRITNGALLFPAVDYSNTAFTFVVMCAFADDTDTKQLVTSETSARVVNLAWSRAGTPGGNAVDNSMSLYRRVGATQDQVWTTDLLGKTADGVCIHTVAKVNGGGAGNEADINLFKGSGSSWSAKANSPTKLNFQLANGDAPGSDGYTSVGSFGSTSEKWNGDIVYMVAGFTTKLSNAQIASAVAAKSTAAFLALGPAQCYDYKDGLVADLSGHGLDRISASGNTAVAGVSSSLWTPGA